jgi:hypothetical protein
MIKDFMQKVSAKWGDRLVLWVQEKAYRTIAVLISLTLFSTIFALVIKFIKVEHIKMAVSFTKELIYVIFSPNIIIIFILFFVVLSILIYLCWIGYSSKNISIKINDKIKPEDYFLIDSRSSNSGWSYLEDKDTPFAKVLSITSADLPGYLKKGAEWYDYEFSFKAKIKTSNFTFAIRVKDWGNCIFFQCSEKSIYPHLVIDGVRIKHFKDISLPLELPKEEWIDVKVVVRGNRVEIGVFGMSKEFTIPSFSKYVYLSGISDTMEYNDVERMDNEILAIMGNLNKMRKSRGLEENDDDEKLVEDVIKRVVEKEKVEFDKGVLPLSSSFERGSVGFRACGSEHALFKDIKVKLLDKIL